ncbi:B-cell receptor CD22-like isoform X3 [Synchiropus splendidus]|uniref:B-cell receptor CD22-like isoform X3 n=1 Tax=Synchiropus splendidus TaxID=270530 RepID=UPI00237D4D98|nr:B-cell receptor CD22-like isoform X3 [Synchiropus splendidus]
MDKEKLMLLLLLTIITAAGSAAVPSFTFTGSQLTATEGSCVPIQASFTGYLSRNAYWAWFKDPVWVGTVVYSTDPTKRPISPQYSNRVTYQRAEKQLTISICNLNKNDGGSYSFGYFPSRGEKWSSEPVLLSVQANPCLIRFEEPAPVTESRSVTLRCSTLSSCPSRPQIQPLDQRGISVQPQGDEHSRTATSNFTASWQDNGRQFSCQTQGNTDPNLIRSVTLTVEYGPRNVEVRVTNPDRREGVAVEDTVTLTCSASGNPAPTYHWLQPDQAQSQGQDLIIPSITVSQSGRYRCEARNKHGHEDSSLDLDVQFSPEVEITAFATSIRRGQRMDLRCTVKRSNPEATSFQWQKDQRDVSSAQTYTVRSIQPEHAGFYTCTAWNSIGAGTSDPLQIQVEYQPRNTRVQVPSGLNGRVSAGKELRLTCVTEASPAAHSFSWFHGSSRHTPLSQYQSKYWGSTMTIETVQRSDEGCYVCSATNSIGTDHSAPQCFQVQYAPSNLKLSMYTQVTEGQTFTIRCTVDSFPPSTLTLIRETGSSSVNVSSDSNKNGVHNNVLVYTTKAAVHHAGSYKCIASNSEGSRTSERRELVVQYAPKETKVLKAEELQLPDKRSSVMLTCSSSSYPPIHRYSWYRKSTDDRGDDKVSDQQNHSVTSDKPGIYYCSALNQLGERRSDPVELFVEGASHKVLMYVFISASLLLIPLAAGLIFIKCKRRLKHRANPSAKRPPEVQAVPPEEASVVYANVHYAKGKPGQDVVYAVVSKPHHPNKPSGEEGEEEVNYSHVEFKHNRVKHKIGKSSRCEDENTEYSTIKF